MLYRKYRVTKQVLEYEQGDIIHQASVPRSETELSQISMREQKMKYTNLTENPPI